MKRISLMLLAVCLLFFASAFNPKRVPAQAPLPAPVDLDIPTPPTAVRAGGKIHLFYELHITNFRPQSLELTGVEIYEEETRAKPLASHKENSSAGSRGPALRRICRTGG